MQQRGYADDLADRAEDEEFLRWNRRRASNPDTHATSAPVAFCSSSSGYAHDDFDALEWSDMASSNPARHNYPMSITSISARAASPSMAQPDQGCLQEKPYTAENHWNDQCELQQRWEPKAVVKRRDRRSVPREAMQPHETLNATTLMLCNIPCRATIEEVVTAVHSLGFENTYDFLYVPGATCCYGKAGVSRNLGYAFVNFLTAEVARHFVIAFDGFSFGGRYSSKKGVAKIARVQGLENNLMHADMSKCVLPQREVVLQ